MKPGRDDWDEDERRALKDVESELEQLRARHRDDPPLELLRAADADALPPALQESIGDHLRQSAWSRALVEGANEAEPAFGAEIERRVLDRIKRPERSARSSRWYARPWFPALATAAVLVVMVGVWRRSEPSRPVEPAGVPAETPAPAPAAPVFVLPLDRPDVKLTPQALVLRSDAGGSQFAHEVGPALKAYQASDYAEAERQFAALQVRYPKSVEVPFYRSIAQLFLNDPARAIESLQTARRLDDETFAAEIAWFLAVGYERANDPPRARAELDALCRHTSAFATRACDAAPKLQSK